MTSSSPHAGSATRSSLDDGQRALVGMETLLAIAAFAGSCGLISGSVDTSSYADRLPLSSPALGGVALALVVALPAAFAVTGALCRRAWARHLHPVVGGLLMGWIVVQVGVIGLDSWLQPVMFAWGAVVAFLGIRNLQRAAP